MESFTLKAKGVAFPSFSFGPNHDGETVQVTHHYLDVSRDSENLKVLRRRTDTLSIDTARKLYGALQSVGFTLKD